MDTQEPADPPPSFIEPLVNRALTALQPLTVYYWLAKRFGDTEHDPQKKLPHLSWWGVDVYVVSFTVFSMVTYCAALGLPRWFLVVVLLLGGVRIFEITRFQLELLLAKRTNALRGYRRSFLLLVCNYLEITLWFSAAYIALFRWQLLIVSPNATLLVTLRESLGLMVANSSGGFVNPEGWPVWTIMLLQCLLGLFMTTIVAARVISLLPPPSTLDPDEGAHR
jgi:hypothetical protein